MSVPDHPGPDYTLRWPRELFVREARAVYDAPKPLRDWTQPIELLLKEAFVSDEPATSFRAADLPGRQTGGSSTKLRMHPQQQFFTRLIEVAERLPEEAAPRPYYGQRRPSDGDDQVSQKPDLPGARRAWATSVRDLRARGYLSRVAPRRCVDDADDELPEDTALEQAITERIGRQPYFPWLPLQPDGWDDEVTFYRLVEVFHDLVARPRNRYFHDFGACGWHYSNFAVEPGQILYRWTVNRLLARHGIPLQLAKSGEDIGRLVHAPPDDRERLVTAAVIRPGTTGDQVRHAVSLFRSREATAESKRSACITLVGVLEARRTRLEDQLLSKDEGALFHIANKFAIRHQKADQHPDYDEAYLDWIFWWYLATIELTDRLVDRSEATSG